MPRKLPIIFLVICAAGFAFGIAELFKLRFETGDVYPAYSSLRTDPLGTSALFEGLEQMPGLTAHRDYSSTGQLPDGRATAYLHLAAHTEDWEELPEDTAKEIDSFLRRGGRLMVAFYPEAGHSTVTSFRIGMARAQKGGTNFPPLKSNPPGQKTKPSNDGSPPTVSMTERWGVNFALRKLKSGDKGAYEPVEVRNPNEPSLSASLLWHSGEVFTNLDPAWRVIYARGSEPVLIERRFGPGSVVFSTDTFFLSNEAMQKDRHADLLAWVVGSNHQVYFDEAHLGIVEEPGIATLIRQYRLHSLVAGLLVLAALFIWKNSSPLAPALDRGVAEDFVTGKDSAAGFVNLLRRHVPKGQVLHVCLTEWRKSKLDGRYSAVRLARAQEAIAAENARPPRDQDPVRTYREICEALNQTVPAPPPPARSAPPVAGTINLPTTAT